MTPLQVSGYLQSVFDVSIATSGGDYAPQRFNHKRLNMKLQKKSLLALIAVLELASDSKSQRIAADIAGKYDIFIDHLSKIMRSLVHEGMVQAICGVGGGYRFVGNINRTTLFDIIQVFEKLESELDLPHSIKIENPIVAELQSIINEIDNFTKAILSTITLATFMKNTRRQFKFGTNKLTMNHSAASSRVSATFVDLGSPQRAGNRPTEIEMDRDPRSNGAAICCVCADDTGLTTAARDIQYSVAPCPGVDPI